MARGVLVDRLQTRHDRLLTERDACYHGDAPRGEIARWVARRLESDVLGDSEIASPEDYEQDGSRGLLDVWIDLAALYIEFDTTTRRPGDDYRIRIIRLLEAFRYPIPTRVLAGVVCCSTGHARRFYWNEDEERVREKDWSRSQRERQAPPKLVARAKQRDNGCCVRCGATSPLVVHHIQPVSRSGDATLENLATLCESCHVEAHGGSIARGEVAYRYDEFWSWVDSTSRNSISGDCRQSSLQEFNEA